MNRHFMVKLTLSSAMMLSLVSGVSFAKNPGRPSVEINSQEAASPILDGFYNNAEKIAVLDVIKSATKTLDIEIYEMGDPDVVAAIRGVMDKGVTVRVVKEPKPLGETCDLFTAGFTSAEPKCQNQLILKEEILKKNPKNYVAFNKQNLCGKGPAFCFMHGKMVISDSKLVLISTGNFNSSNLCNLAQNPSKCNRDFSVVTRDPEVVSLLQNVFNHDVEEKRYELPTFINSQKVEKVTVSPYSLEPLVRFIGTAKDAKIKTLKIHNQYLKETTFNQAIVKAADDGVKVEITLASLCAFSHPKDADVKKNAESMGKLLTHPNISVKMLPAAFHINGKPGYMHAKAIVVGDEKAWVGSVNGSTSALSNNREFGLFLTDSTSIRKLSKILTDDHASKDMETWDESAKCLKDKTQHPDAQKDSTFHPN